MTLIKFIENRVRFLNGIQGVCHNQDIKNKSEEDVVTSILHKISQCGKSDVSAVNNIMEIISNADFTRDNKSKIVESLGERTLTSTMAKPEVDKIEKKQCHSYMENYFTVNEWRELAGMDVETTEKIKIIAKAILRCGWCYQSEPELACVIAILTTLGFADIGNDSLEHLQSLKVLVSKMMVKEKSKLAVDLVDVFPKNPKMLPEPWRSMAFRDGDLIQSPLNENEFNQNKSIIPCRKTSKFAKGIIPQAKDAPRPSPSHAEEESAVSISNGGRNVQSDAFNMMNAMGCPNQFASMMYSMVMSMMKGQNENQAAEPQLNLEFMQKNLKRSMSGGMLALHDSPEKKLKSIGESDSAHIESSPQQEFSESLASSSLSDNLTITTKSDTLTKHKTAEIKSPASDLLAAASVLGSKCEAKPESEDADDESETSEEESCPKKKVAKKRNSITKKQKKKKQHISMSLKFPGTLKKGYPLFYGDSTVYIDTNSGCWRLKKKSGDRLCQHFYFKKYNPKQIWKTVVLELRRLNG